MAGPAEGQRVLRGDDLLYLWTLPPGHLLDAYSVKKFYLTIIGHRQIGSKMFSQGMHRKFGQKSIFRKGRISGRIC